MAKGRDPNTKYANTKQARFLLDQPICIQCSLQKGKQHNVRWCELKSIKKLNQIMISFNGVQSRVN